MYHKSRSFASEKGSFETPEHSEDVTSASQSVVPEKSPEIVDYITKAVKIFRKYSGAVGLASQDLEDFLNNMDKK